MRHLTSVALAALLATGAAVSPAAAGPFTPYSLVTTIAVPSAGSTINPAGTFRTFDISFFDPTTRIDYVADRSNAGVDAFSSNLFLGRVPGFAGQTGSNNSTSGPDGVLTVSNGLHTLFAGDGPSLLKTFNISGGLPAPQQFPPLNTGGKFRVDEMAYSPSANLVLVANNADMPAFGTLVNASTGAVVHGHIVIPGGAPTDGLEQPVWDPTTNSFFISVPQIAGAGAGGVAEIKTDGTVGTVINFANLGIGSCAPTGLALGGSGNLIVGCGTAKTQTVLLDPVAGTIVNKFTQISGSDEVWYDPKTGDFYVTGSNSSGQRVFDIINDLTQSILQSVSVPNVNAHSISVDPGNGFVYIPLPAGAANNLCPNGCIGVYGAAGVPEPGTLPLMIVGMAGLVGLAVRRRIRQ